jgi:PAS domain S-box-containing protein
MSQSIQDPSGGDDPDLLHVLVSAIGDYAIVLLSPDGTILNWNQGAYQYSGYSADEMVGKSISELYAPEDRQAGEPNRHLEKAAEAGSYQDECWLAHKDGSQLWAAISLSKLSGSSGALRGFALVFRDLTHRKRADEQLSQYATELEQARDKAIQASILKSQFVANVSHEIRTPMSGLLGMAELLKYQELPPEAREIADYIYSSAQSLLDILNDLLDFSKIEAGKLVIEKRKIELRNIVNNVVKVATFAAERKNLKLEAHIDRHIPRFALGDQLRLQQILLNFVTNAIKFTEQGTIKISLASMQCDIPGQMLVRFSVKDTGIGIEPEKQAILFQPFVQADGSTSRQFGGTGLGLSISKRLIDLMAGEVGLISRPGHGSTFWFVVPLETAADEENANGRQSAA